jgi:hypothetical protein
MASFNLLLACLQIYQALIFLSHRGVLCQKDTSILYGQHFLVSCPVVAKVKMVHGMLHSHPRLACCYGSHELLLRYAGNLADLVSSYFFRPVPNTSPESSVFPLQPAEFVLVILFTFAFPASRCGVQLRSFSRLRQFTIQQVLRPHLLLAPVEFVPPLL